MHCFNTFPISYNVQCISILTYPHTVYSTIGETMNQPYAPEDDYYAAPKQHDTVRVCVYN